MVCLAKGRPFCRMRSRERLIGLGRVARLPARGFEAMSLIPIPCSVRSKVPKTIPLPPTAYGRETGEANPSVSPAARGGGGVWRAF